MPRNKQNKNSSKRQSSRRTNLVDIPRAPKRTYTTASCRLPRITDECVIRSSGTPATITASGSFPANATYNFSLSLAGVNSGFFDRYMIEAIRFTITPQNNAVGLLGPTVAYTDLYCVIDYDDSTALTTLASAQGYGNCVRLSPGESLERTFAPRIAISAYNGAFGAYANQRAQWIDSVSTTVQHYGVKIFVPATGIVGQTTLQSWDVNVEYFIRFKNVI
jgi:hypothetical protein